MGVVLDMGKTLCADELSNYRPTAGEALDRKGPHRAEPRLTPSEKEDREAAAVLDAGCAAFGSNRDAAKYLDLDESLLTKMRQGTRPTSLRVIHQLRKIERCALAMGEVEARIAGVAPCRPLRKAKRQEVLERVVMRAKTCAALWRWLSRDVADDLATTTDDVEAALLELA
jgi:hypothetical protein